MKWRSDSRKKVQKDVRIKIKSWFALAIERAGKGISRMYAPVVPDASSESLRPIFKDHIDMNATVKTDKWLGYKPLENQYSNLTQIKSGEK